MTSTASSSKASGRVTSLDTKELAGKLRRVAKKFGVVGGVLGVRQGDDIVEIPFGVANRNTGVPVTTDTLFQIGSITKVWTATLVMMLVDDGVLDLDEPVVTYLPEFKVKDRNVTRRVTLRHLLSHSSGIGGDHILDTGRGADTLERYVKTCATIGQEHDLGATMSYCNTGYSVVGRIIEKVTGKSWDAVLRERLIEPLGLTHTNTLPEEAMVFRNAVGHAQPPGADAPVVVPTWVLPRSVGPAGLINATAADTMAFGQFHLDKGKTPKGKRILSAESVKRMQQTEVEVPDKFTLGDRWGIGWILFNWDGHALYGHDGTTLGQRAYMRVLPEANLIVALVSTGGTAGPVFREVCGEIMGELAGVTSPPWPTVPKSPPNLDLSVYEGGFGRLNQDLEVSATERGTLTATLTMSGPMAEAMPADQRSQNVEFVPVDNEVFLLQMDGLPMPIPLVFFDFDGDRPKRLHFGTRAMTRRH